MVNVLSGGLLSVQQAVRRGLPYGDDSVLPSLHSQQRRAGQARACSLVSVSEWRFAHKPWL